VEYDCIQQRAVADATVSPLSISLPVCAMHPNASTAMHSSASSRMIVLLVQTEVGPLLSQQYEQRQGNSETCSSESLTAAHLQHTRAQSQSPALLFLCFLRLSLCSRSVRVLAVCLFLVCANFSLRAGGNSPRSSLLQERPSPERRRERKDHTRDKKKTCTCQA
jgi:hypothetical protein